MLSSSKVEFVPMKPFTTFNWLHYNFMNNLTYTNLVYQRLLWSSLKLQASQSSRYVELKSFENAAILFWWSTEIACHNSKNKNNNMFRLTEPREIQQISAWRKKRVKRKQKKTVNFVKIVKYVKNEGVCCKLWITFFVLIWNFCCCYKCM
jgi:hypothetical protein